MPVKFDANEHAHKHELLKKEFTDDREKERFTALFVELSECVEDGHERTALAIRVRADVTLQGMIEGMTREEKVRSVKSVMICAGRVQTAAIKFREAAEHCEELVKLCTEKVE